MWSKELDYEFVESSEDGDFMLALDAVKLVKETFWTDIKCVTFFHPSVSPP